MLAFEHVPAVGDVLQDLVDSVPYMWIPVGVGWPVVEGEGQVILSGFMLPAVEVTECGRGDDFPVLVDPLLVLQPRRKCGAWKLDRVTVAGLLPT